MNDYDLIVVGGGPAGSTAAAIAARAGLKVLLLEAAQHPRTHVGESLLPGIIPILEKSGALADVEAAGFTRKTGSTHWGWGRTPEWDLWFTDSDQYPYAWLVDRSRFDEILFRAAARAGAEAHEHASVKSFLRDGDRVVGVTWKKRGEDDVREARAPITFDASGQAMLIARELKLRTLIPGLQHEAAWAHFEGAGRLTAPRQDQALFVATSSEWLWHFPLSDTRTSVGVIRLHAPEQRTNEETERAFDRMIDGSPQLKAVLGDGARRVTSVRTQHDWSYRISQITGPGWFLVGDASGFIDPVLSTGVLLAMHAAFHATSLVIAAHEGAITEDSAREQYERQHRTLFDDLLRIVKYFYQHNLYRDDYFWESKRILIENTEDVSPRKAFMVLTSGLANNLAFDEKLEATRSRRLAVVDAATQEAEPDELTALRYACVQLRWHRGDDKVPLYFIIEPIDTSAPTLFTTTNWHINCLSPPLNNDPILVPQIAPHLRALDRVIRELDTSPGESLGTFWSRSRTEIAAAVRALPEQFELVRVFGG